MIWDRPRQWPVNGLRLLFALALVAIAWLIPGAGREAWATCTGNAIVCENALTGNAASQWDISGAGDSSIQGFATDISVNKGQTVHFKINTSASAYRLDIYRMGYYGGLGARKVATISPSASLPQFQPACVSDGSTGLLDCGNWAESASWSLPATAVSGIYFAKLVRTDTGGASHIVFIVRDDTGQSDLLFQTSDTTWQAYNDYGGNSLYVGGSSVCSNRACKVSYNRPFNTRADSAHDWVFNAEYPMVRWLEANGYNVSYAGGVDSDRLGGNLLQHKVFLSVGHDEYWSGGQRANVEAARAAGVHLAFFSGNEIFWKTRWEDSIDGTFTPYRTLVTYKETHANAVIDPADPPTWTGTWRDPRFSPPADGGRPENALSGTIFMVNDSGASYSITVPQAYSALRFWRNTSVATLPSGGTATLAANTLGYEWDEALDNGVQPPGLIRMSSTTRNMPSLLLDYGSTYGSGTATHNLTLYRHGSGALVFGAGTIQWSWGLDGHHDGASSTPDVRMQQATVNLFADMRIQPGTLQSGLVPATASTDTTPPTSTITSPANGATLPVGGPVTFTGTASDTGGGVVAAVWVSVDGGLTWQLATGRGSWSYAWTPRGSGGMTIQSRAVDDSGNLETPSAGVTVTVGSGSGGACPCTIWSPSTTPVVASDPDTSAVEVGVKFRASVSGSITSIRFYKAATNTGTHVGNLWTSTGTLLTSATFTNESASGWQQADFATPVAITANTTYVASYHTNVGHYADDTSYFASSGVTSGPLTALADGVDGPNGVYAYGATSTFPNQTWNTSNYWVDVVFMPLTSTTYTIAGAITPSANGSGATVSLSGTASATTTADANGNYSFPGLANGNYTVTPSKSGFTFSPVNQAVAINGANPPAVNFTAAPLPAGLAIDATAWGDQGTAKTTVTASSFLTKSSNELLLAFISADSASGANTTVTNVSGAGLTWVLVLRTNVQLGTAEIWRAFAAAPLTNVTVTATLSQAVASSLTVLSFTGVNTSGTNGSGAVGATGTGNANPGAPTASLTTTRNNSWVFGVGNDWDNSIARTAGTNQTLLHQYMPPVGDTYWVQRMNTPTATAGTIVTVNDTAPTGDRYNLSIVEVLTP